MWRTWYNAGDFCNLATNKKSDEKVRKDNEEARKKLQTSQEQFNKTIEEMQKEREEAYKPDLYMDTEERIFSISRDSDDVTPLKNESKSFSITNIGVGTAKNIIVEAYYKENSNYLSDYTKTYLNIPEKDNVILYSLPD